MDILTIFDDSELRCAAVYPFQSSLIHVRTPVGRVGTIVGILILVLLICAKFQSSAFSEKSTNRVSYEGHRKETTELHVLPLVLCT